MRNIKYDNPELDFAEVNFGDKRLIIGIIIVLNNPHTHLSLFFEQADRVFFGLDLLEVHGWGLSRFSMPLIVGEINIISKMILRYSLVKILGVAVIDWVRQNIAFINVNDMFAFVTTLFLPPGIGLFWISSSVFVMLREIFLLL